MKLHYLATSPFVRKVLVAAIETGTDGRIERIPADIRSADSDYYKVNPLAKVPALVRDDGSLMVDSPVICEFLDSLHDGPKLIPADGPARFAVLHLQALADGITDAAVLYKNERDRPDGERSDEFRDRQRAKAARGLDHIEANLGILDGLLNIGQIALASGLGWIQLRIGRDFWAEGRPGLEKWMDAFAERPSMQATAPSPA